MIFLGIIVLGLLAGMLQVLWDGRADRAAKRRLAEKSYRPY